MPNVVVNWNLCSGSGNCVDMCPVGVFELHEILEHPETLKAVPVKIQDCTFCMKCMTACTEHAITIKKD